MNAIFRLTTSELNDNFIEMLKRDFKDFSLEILAIKEEDETNYILSTKANKESINRSLDEYNKHKIVSKNIDELE